MEKWKCVVATPMTRKRPKNTEWGPDQTGNIRAKHNSKIYLIYSTEIYATVEWEVVRGEGPTPHLLSFFSMERWKKGKERHPRGQRLPTDSSPPLKANYERCEIKYCFGGLARTEAIFERRYVCYYFRSPEIWRLNESYFEILILFYSPRFCEFSRCCVEWKRRITLMIVVRSILYRTGHISEVLSHTVA